MAGITKGRTLTERRSDTVYYVDEMAGRGHPNFQDKTVYSLIEVPRPVAEEVAELDRKIVAVNLELAPLAQAINDIPAYAKYVRENRGRVYLDARFDRYFPLCDQRTRLLYVPRYQTVYAVTSTTPYDRHGIVEKDAFATVMSYGALEQMQSMSSEDVDSIAKNAIRS